MLDVCAWIRSKEVQDFLREQKDAFSFEERLTLIRTALRPIEERLEALKELLDETAVPEEKEQAEQVIRLYQFMIREIYESRPGQIYIRKLPSYRGNEYDLDHGRPYVYGSYEEMTAAIPETGDVWECGNDVEKWEVTEDGARELLTFTLYPWGNGRCVTSISMDDRRCQEAGVDQEVIRTENHRGSFWRYPCFLPFSSGDLVCLDAPCYLEPVYGILYKEKYGKWYLHMGVICEEDGIWRFGMLNLLGVDMNGSLDCRAIDWLHGADPKDLPGGQEILGELAAYLKDLRRQDPERFEKLFWQIFLHAENDSDIRPFRRIPVTLQELLGACENAGT